ncbi:MAG: hypothetical protein WCD04_00360, partial [Terriglobia bacterium]
PHCVAVDSYFRPLYSLDDSPHGNTLLFVSLPLRQTSRLQAQWNLTCRAAPFDRTPAFAQDSA